MKNVFVQYRGGSYDGCFWEWNFFFFDKDGKFHDIFSSGSAGITNQTDAEKELENHVYIYDITSKSAWQEFCKESHPALVIGVAKWFEEHDIEPMVFCSECGQITDEPVYDEERSGNQILCLDCFGFGLCEICEYWSSDIQPHQDKYLCPDCIEYRKMRN